MKNQIVLQLLLENVTISEKELYDMFCPYWGLGGLRVLLDRYASHKAALSPKYAPIKHALIVSKPAGGENTLKPNNIEHLYQLAQYFKTGPANKISGIKKNPEYYAAFLALIVYWQNRAKQPVAKYMNELKAFYANDKDMKEPVTQAARRFSQAQKSPVLSLAPNSFSFAANASQDEKPELPALPAENVSEPPVAASNAGAPPIKRIQTIVTMNSHLLPKAAALGRSMTLSQPVTSSAPTQVKRSASWPYTMKAKTTKEFLYGSGGVNSPWKQDKPEQSAAQILAAGMDEYHKHMQPLSEESGKGADVSAADVSAADVSEIDLVELYEKQEKETEWKTGLAVALAALTMPLLVVPAIWYFTASHSKRKEGLQNLGMLADKLQETNWAIALAVLTAPLLIGPAICYFAWRHSKRNEPLQRLELTADEEQELPEYGRQVGMPTVPHEEEMLVMKLESRAKPNGKAVYLMDKYKADRLRATQDRKAREQRSAVLSFLWPQSAMDAKPAPLSEAEKEKFRKSKEESVNFARTLRRQQ